MSDASVWYHACFVRGTSWPLPITSMGSSALSTCIKTKGAFDQEVDICLGHDPEHAHLCSGDGLCALILQIGHRDNIYKLKGKGLLFLACHDYHLIFYRSL